MFLDQGIQHQKDIDAPYKFNMICFLKVFFSGTRQNDSEVHMEK